MPEAHFISKSWKSSAEVAGRSHALGYQAVKAEGSEPLGLRHVAAQRFVDAGPTRHGVWL